MPTPWFNTPRVGEKAQAMSVLLLPDKAAMDMVLMQYLMVRPAQLAVGFPLGAINNNSRVPYQFLDAVHIIGICRRHRAALVIRVVGDVRARLAAHDFRMAGELRHGFIPFVERTAKEIDFPFAYRIYDASNQNYNYSSRSKDQLGRALRLVLNQQFFNLLDGTTGAVDLMQET